MKKQYPIIHRDIGGGDSIPTPVEPPKLPGEAMFHSGRWTVWKINGVPKLYETRPFKVRPTEKDRPVVHHHDCVEVGNLEDINIQCGIDVALLNEAKEFCDYHTHGLTADV